LNLLFHVKASHPLDSTVRLVKYRSPTIGIKASVFPLRRELKFILTSQHCRSKIRLPGMFILSYDVLLLAYDVLFLAETILPLEA